jgi:hypothetical protein
VPNHSGNTNLTLRDADGTNVTFSLIGGGTGEVIQDGSQWDIRLTGTTSQSVLTVFGLGGNNRVSIDDIHVQGPLGGVLAANTDLVGNLTIDGPVKAGLLLGSASGTVISAPTIEGTTIQGVNVQGIVVGNLNQTTIQIGAAPVVNDQTFSVAENGPNGTVVGTIVATGNALTFSSSPSAFAVNSTTGQITVINSSFLDFETNPIQGFGVTVTDAGNLTDSARITINLIDVPGDPVILPPHDVAPPLGFDPFSASQGSRSRFPP